MKMDGYTASSSHPVVGILIWHAGGLSTGSREVFVFSGRGTGGDKIEIKQMCALYIVHDLVIHWGWLNPNLISIKSDMFSKQVLCYDGPVTNGNFESFVRCQVPLSVSDLEVSRELDQSFRAITGVDVTGQLEEFIAQLRRDLPRSDSRP